jgi:hypothetical protein
MGERLIRHDWEGEDAEFERCRCHLPAGMEQTSNGRQLYGAAVRFGRCPEVVAEEQGTAAIGKRELHDVSHRMVPMRIPEHSPTLRSRSSVDE